MSEISLSEKHLRPMCCSTLKAELPDKIEKYKKLPVDILVQTTALFLFFFLFFG